MRELDPEAAALLEAIEQLGRPPTYALSVESAREALDNFFGGREGAPVGDVQEFSVPGPAGAVPVRLYSPSADGPHPLLVFFHGGGWVLGGLDTHDTVCRRLCASGEFAVLSVDYRLAPEHPFPAALHDCYAAVEWAATHASEVGADPDRIAVGGDSAGGNLAAGVSLLARDRDGPDVVHQALVYPAVASPAAHEFPSYEENGEGYFLERDSSEWFYERYVQDDVHRRNSYLAPLLASDLSALPAATVLTAGFDLLRDEGRAYADRLEDAGVPVARESFPGMIHGFVNMPDELSAANEALDAVAANLRASFDA